MTTWQQIAAIAGAFLFFACGIFSIRRAITSFRTGEFEGTENPSPDVIRRERPALFWIAMFIHITGGVALILFGFIFLFLALFTNK